MASAAAEKVFKTAETSAEAAASEKLAENILSIESGTAGTAAAAGVGIMPELVVLTAFFGVAQCFIGGRNLFEFFLGFFVAGVFIRMVLDRQFAVCFFDFISGSGSASYGMRNGGNYAVMIYEELLYAVVEAVFNHFNKTTNTVNEV